MDNRQVYVAPRLHAELADAGVHVGRKRVARLMRAAQIVGCHRRKRSFSITQQNPTADVAPDRVDRKFVASAPKQLWVADVTYVPTVQGWLYLACVTDVFSLRSKPRQRDTTRSSVSAVTSDRTQLLALMTSLRDSDRSRSAARELGPH